MSQAWMEMYLNICFIINTMEHMLKSYIQPFLAYHQKLFIKHPPAHEITAESKSLTNVKCVLICVLHNMHKDCNFS